MTAKAHPRSRRIAARLPVQSRGRGQRDLASSASGMPALDPDRKFVPGTLEAEAELAWGNAVAIAGASGLFDRGDPLRPAQPWVT